MSEAFSPREICSARDLTQEDLEQIYASVEKYPVRLEKPGDLPVNQRIALTPTEKLGITRAMVDCLTMGTLAALDQHFPVPDPQTLSLRNPQPQSPREQRHHVIRSMLIVFLKTHVPAFRIPPPETPPKAEAPNTSGGAIGAVRKALRNLLFWRRS